MNEPSVVAESVDSLVARVSDEFVGRQRRGERPDVEEYVARHPEHAGVLRPVLVMLALAGPALSAVAGEAGPAGDEAAGGTLGDFRIVREVGRGGMGVVYEAEQISLRRRVALKVLPFAATMDPRRLQRFHNEAYAAASLHHEHIVPVHAVGCERGLHFYAMQFIDGRTLAQVLAARHGPADADATANYAGARPAAETVAAASTMDQARGTAYHREVARLGVEAALALEHAHTLGIVHRDVKPGNLMLDGWGKVWVTDFGLARLGDEPGVTMSGDLLGTLRYMSPEQALARHGLVDHRTDVYSLGVTLYELLTLRPAIAGKDRQEVLKNIAFEEPVPPRKIDAGIPVDLETVVLKAMAKNPRERYATARELADDLRRWLEDRPVQARRPGLATRAVKWLRRHRGLTTAASVMLAVTFVALVASTLYAATAYQAEAAERRRAEDAEKEEEKQRHIAEKQRDDARYQLYISQMRQAGRAWADANMDRLRGLLDANLPTGNGADLRGWEWHYLEGLTRREIATLDTGTNVGLPVWSPDSRRLAVLCETQLQIWDPAKGEKKVIQTGPKNGLGRPLLTWSPDGRSIAWIDTGKRATIVWDLAKDRQGQAIPIPERFFFMPFLLHWNQNGNQPSALAMLPLTESVWDVIADKAILKLPVPGKEVTNRRGMRTGLHFFGLSPSGRYLTVRSLDSGSRDGILSVWDLSTGTSLCSFTDPGVQNSDLTWSCDGSLIARACTRGGMKVYDAKTGKEVSTIPGSHSSAWDPSGLRLAAPSSRLPQAIQVWDARTGQELRTFRGHAGHPTLVSWSPDGRCLASAERGGIIKVWKADSHQECETLDGHTHAVAQARWSPDGRRLASCAPFPKPGQATLTIWDWAARKELCSIQGLTTHSIAWGPDSQRIAAPIAFNQYAVWDATTGRQECVVGSGRPVNHRGVIGWGGPIDWSPDGRFLTALCHDLAVRVWELQTRRQVATFNYASGVGALAWSPDGRYLALSAENAVLIYETATWRNPTVFWAASRDFGHQPLAWSPDSRFLAAAEGNNVAVWNVNAGEKALRLHGPSTKVVDLSWSPKGQRLAGASSTGVGTVWETVTGQEVLTLDDVGQTVSWCPEGVRLATGSRLGTSVRVYDSRPVDRPLRPSPVYKARELLDRAKALSLQAGLLNKLGRVHEAEQRYRESLKCHQEIVAHFPPEPAYRRSHAISQFDLAKQLHRVQRVPEAEEAYLLAIASWRTLGGAREGTPDVSLARMYDGLARVYLAQRQFRKAIEQYEKAVDCYGSHRSSPGGEKADLENNFAWLLVTCADTAVRDPNRATDLARKATAQVPERGTFWNTLGVALSRKGEWREAVQALTRSINLREGGDSFDYFFLAIAHWQLGDEKQGRQWYDRAVQWMDKNRPTDEELLRFRAEAARVVNTGGRPVPKPPAPAAGN